MWCVASQQKRSSRPATKHLPCFGCGAEHGKREWQSLVRQLVAAGFLHLDIQGYGGLTITDKGRALLRGAESFQYRQDAVTRSAGKKKATPVTVASTVASELSGDEVALLDALKVLRLRLAKARGVPAYVIFPDKSLIDMARRAPATPEAFAEVSGVGKAKLKDFAAPFLKAIAAAKAAPQEEPDGGQAGERPPEPDGDAPTSGLETSPTASRLMTSRLWLRPASPSLSNHRQWIGQGYLPEARSKALRKKNRENRAGEGDLMQRGGRLRRLMEL